MKKKKDFTRFCQSTQPITCRHGLIALSAAADECDESKIILELMVASFHPHWKGRSNRHRAKEQAKGKTTKGKTTSKGQNYKGQNNRQRARPQRHKKAARRKEGTLASSHDTLEVLVV